VKNPAIGCFGNASHRAIEPGGRGKGDDRGAARPQASKMRRNRAGGSCGIKVFDQANAENNVV
jgi:hypothetical protein